MHDAKLLDSLLRLYQKLDSSMQFAELLHAVRDEISGTLGLKAVWYFLLSDDQKYFERLEHTGITPNPVTFTKMYQVEGDLLLEEMIRTSSAIFIEDARNDPRTNKVLVKKNEARSIINIPNRLKNKRMGVFGTGTFGSQGVRSLSKPECEYLKNIASHVTALLDRTLTNLNKSPADKIQEESKSKFRIDKDLGLIGSWEYDVATKRLQISPNWHERIKEIDQHKSLECLEEWARCIHPDDKDKITEQIQAYLANPDGRLFLEYRMLLKNSDYHWIHSENEIQHDDDGRPLRMVGRHLDVTERKLLDETRYANEHQIRHFVEHAPVGMAMFDRNMNCLAASERWTKGYSKGPSDRAGLNHYEIHPHLPNRLKIIHNRALQGESLKNDCEFWVHPDGTKIWMSWSVCPWIDASGSIGGIIMAGEEISYRIDLVEITSREQQRIAQDLHDTVSQELTALHMLTKVLYDSLDSEPDRIKSMVKLVDDGLRRSMKVLRDIMKGLTPVNVPADGLVPALIDLAEQAKRQGANQCKLHCPEIHFKLSDDFIATQVYMIIKEAVHNALKHCGPKSIEITVRCQSKLCFIVKNDCENMKVPEMNKHFGLGRQIMQNRALIIGAELEFETLKPNGMQVTCRLGDHLYAS